MKILFVILLIYENGSQPVCEKLLRNNTKITDEILLMGNMSDIGIQLIQCSYILNELAFFWIYV